MSVGFNVRNKYVVVGLKGQKANNVSVQNDKQLNTFKIMFTKISELLLSFYCEQDQILRKRSL